MNKLDVLSPAACRSELFSADCARHYNPEIKYPLYFNHNKYLQEWFFLATKNSKKYFNFKKIPRQKSSQSNF